MVNHPLSARRLTLPLIALLIALFALSGCSNTELDNCIDQQSHLWDNTTNDPKANQAYWQAVKQCREKYQ